MRIKKMLSAALSAAMVLGTMAVPALADGDSIALNYNTLSVARGSVRSLVATVSGDQTISWSSSDTSVATVEAKSYTYNNATTLVGVVTPLTQGTAEITANYGTGSAVCTVTVNNNMSYNTFAAAITANNGSFNGNDSAYNSYAHDSSGRLVVEWSPVSGCRQVENGNSNHQLASCDHATAATYETPNRVNGSCAQYQLLAGTSYDASISNVSFQYALAGDQANGSFWYDANGWNGTQASNYEAGEIQLENDGDITITNCAFAHAALTPYHTGATTQKNLTVTSSKFADIGKAGLRGINSKKVNISDCEFINCDSGSVDFVQNNSRIDGDIVLSNNVVNGPKGYKLRNITNKVYVTGDNTSVTVSSALYSYDTAGTDVSQYLVIIGGTFNQNVHGYITGEYAVKQYGDTYKVIPKETYDELADGVTVKTAVNDNKYNQVTAVTANSATKVFKVSTTGAETDLANHEIELNGIEHYIGSVLCGLIINNIPEGVTVTVTAD